MTLQFKNNATTTLSGSINDTQTGITVNSSASFPALTASNYFYASMYELSGSTEINMEIVKVTATSGNNWTVVRGQDGTTARSRNGVATCYIELRMTAASAALMLQKDENLADLANAGTARTNLGLGSIATQAADSVAITGGSISGITLTNLDASTTFQDNGDATKQMRFELSGIDTATTRTLTVPNASGTLALTSDLTAGYQPLDADLTAIAGLSASGLIARTGAGTVAVRSIAVPASGLSITNPDGVSGNPTIALANDLAAVESINTTGFVKRTAADTWTASAIVDGDLPSALTGKTYNALTLTANPTGFSISGGTTSKTLNVSNTITLAGTDSSTLNIGGGGTLGSAAFTDTSAYTLAAGSTSLVTLGTVTTGTWNATAIGIAYGGTGATTAAGAFNALSPITTLGDIVYGDGANSATRLAGNTTTNRRFLRQTGTGSASAAPAWDGLADGDVPAALTGKTVNGITLTANATGFSAAGGTTSKTLTVSNSITLAGTDGTTITLPASSGTVPLNNQTFFLGTTSIAINRGSGAISLTGVSIDGSAGSASSATTATTATNLAGGNNTTLLGAIGYQSNSNTTTLLSPNTTASKQFLSQTGTGTNGAAPAWSAIAKGDVGLSNVENTALSTWAGSANLTTLGTIGSGTWQGSAIGISYGGTGQTSKAAGFNALSPVTTLGDIIYGDGANSATRLAGNTTSNKRFLTQTGTGSASAAPGWNAIVDGDIPSALTGKTYNGLTLTANATGFQVAGGTTSKTLVISNNLTFSGTDGATLNIGGGGTLGTGAYATIANYAPLASPTFTGTPAAPTAAVDTNTTQLATTAYVIGQGYLKSATASSTYAALASPTFTGTPAAPTAAVDTNTTQIATTAYVIGQGYLKSATASSTYAVLASPTFTGTPAAPTAAANTNTTQIATTAFVLGQGNSTAGTIAMDGTQAAGSSNLYARADHVHPTDTSRAPLASPTFTGTPAAPTAAVDTNTTQLATTAYVVAQGYLKSATASSTYLALSGGALTGGLREARVAMAANDINLNSGNYFTKTLSAGSVTLTVSNTPSAGTAASFILDLTNGGTATITWWSGMKWAGGTAPTLTSSGRDTLGFFTHDGGATWTGLLLGKDVK